MLLLLVMITLLAGLKCMSAGFELEPRSTCFESDSSNSTRTRFIKGMKKVDNNYYNINQKT